MNCLNVIKPIWATAETKKLKRKEIMYLASRGKWKVPSFSQYCVRSKTLIITYLLTPWSRDLLEKLTVSQLVKKYTGFYGNRRFITGFTSVQHLSLSWSRPIKSTSPHPSYWRFIVILQFHLRLGLSSGLFLSGLPNKTLYVESGWNLMAHGDARVGKWRGNRRMEWVASTLPLYLGTRSIQHYYQQYKYTTSCLAAC